MLTENEYAHTISRKWFFFFSSDLSELKSETFNVGIYTQGTWH